MRAVSSGSALFAKVSTGLQGVQKEKHDFLEEGTNFAKGDNSVVSFCKIDNFPFVPLVRNTDKFISHYFFLFHFFKTITIALRIFLHIVTKFTVYTLFCTALGILSVFTFLYFILITMNIKKTNKQKIVLPSYLLSY